MSAIKWTKELLAECRNDKGVVFGMMSEEAKKAIASLNHQKGERQYHTGNGWELDLHSVVSKCVALRVTPSYTPPELEEKKWVDVPVTVNPRNLLMYKTPNPLADYEFTIECAAASKSFMGYVYADGMVTVFPRRDDFDCGIATAPVAVRFWNGGDA